VSQADEAAGSLLAAGVVPGIIGRTGPVAMNTSSALGPIIVRHLPPNLVRWMAATFGFILAIYLWVRPP
jgi:uncharacterized membrane protein YfcA